MQRSSEKMYSLTKLSNVISQLRKKRDETSKQLIPIKSQIETLLVKINELETAIIASTQNSHIGAAQCLEAVQSARENCTHAISLIPTACYKSSAKTIKNSNSISSYSVSSSPSASSSTTESTIKVGPEIQTQANQLNKYVQLLFSDKTFLKLLYNQNNLNNSSKDITLSSEKFTSFSNNLDEISARIQSYADLLSWANSKYHEAQEKAIARAMSIPK